MVGVMGGGALRDKRQSPVKTHPNAEAVTREPRHGLRFGEDTISAERTTSPVARLRNSRSPG